MENEYKAILSKTVKIASATCIAVSAVVLIASGAAVKAVTEGSKYLKDTVKKILNDNSKLEIVDVEVPVEEVPVEMPVEKELEFEVTSAV